MIDHKTE